MRVETCQPAAPHPEGKEARRSETCRRFELTAGLDPWDDRYVQPLHPKDSKRRTRATRNFFFKTKEAVLKQKSGIENAGTSLII